MYNKPLRREEGSIKVHIENLRHVSTDEFERKLEEKEVKLIRLLEEEKHLRNEQREF